MAQDKKLMDKLFLISSSMEVIERDKTGRYPYASLENILSSIQGKMNEYKLILYPRFNKDSLRVDRNEWVKTRFDAANKERYQEHGYDMLVYGDAEMVWSDTETGEELVVPWFITGQQADSSQALGSALTYSMRQFLRNFFNVPEANDPDDYANKKQKKEAKEREKALVSKIGELTRSVVKSKEDQDKVSSIVKEIVTVGGKPSANYAKADSPVMLVALLEELNKNFPEFLEEGV